LKNILLLLLLTTSSSCVSSYAYNNIVEKNKKLQNECLENEHLKLEIVRAKSRLKEKLYEKDRCFDRLLSCDRINANIKRDCFGK